MFLTFMPGIYFILCYALPRYGMVWCMLCSCKINHFLIITEGNSKRNIHNYTFPSVINIILCHCLSCSFLLESSPPIYPEYEYRLSVCIPFCHINHLHVPSYRSSVCLPLKYHCSVCNLCIKIKNCLAKKNLKWK